MGFCCLFVLNPNELRVFSFREQLGKLCTISLSTGRYVTACVC